MSPIRLALIGLSAGAKTSWAADAHLPYLLSRKGRSHYEIVALCNSSQAAAEKAILHFGLPSSTKAYGSPEEVAADPDIDLVAVCTRVDVHYGSIKPSLQTGKAAFVEWPLAENVSRAQELAIIASEHKAKTMVGIQARVSPVVLKVQELIKSGTIGKVLSSDVRGYQSLLPRKGLPEGLAYFNDRKVGGNNITIAFAHMIDFVHSSLGEFKSFKSHAQIQQRHVNILGGASSRTMLTDVPDLVFVAGELQSSEHVAPKATLSITYRRDPIPFPGEPAFVWTIFGDKAQIRLTSPAGVYLNSDSYTKPVTIEVAKHETQEVEAIDWQWPDWQEPLLTRGRNIAELYERYATGHVYPTFEDAVVRHEEIDSILEAFAELEQS